eukprot:CAMPEP_0196725222 /NCGR_PEP_ID=MMETSP1091-20130531/6848_1 /TAXON_ID=302021 /ORGANISM="Rhodomonas sp., Strain CCMP768" /LENGTH=70 /DNA_ID=CAMNT_0042067465 /DNA_START=246 /DNA_END=456 /DNA_ORIENTATION=-
MTGGPGQAGAVHDVRERHVIAELQQVRQHPRLHAPTRDYGQDVVDHLHVPHNVYVVRRRRPSAYVIQYRP